MTETGAIPLTRETIDLAMRAPAGGSSPLKHEGTVPLRRAAVLCPILDRPTGLTVLFTRRTDHLKAHPGQISFPGGKIDPGDGSPLAAALREAEEEIGLVPKHVEIAGTLDPYPTGTGFLVTPFVGFVDARFQPVPDPNEVAEVFEIPMEFLMDRNNHERESITRDTQTRSFYVINYDSYRVWGATAGMLRALSDRILRAGQIA